MKEKSTDFVPRVGRPRRENAGDIDVRIIAAATKLFLGKGVAETSYDAIATEAHVGKASLYSRYGSKDELFEAVVRNAVKNTTSAPGPVELSEENFVKRLRQAGTFVLLQALSPVPLELMRLILTEARRNPSLTSEINSRARKQVVALLTDLLQVSGMQQGNDRIGEIVEQFLDLTFPTLILDALARDTSRAVSTAVDQQVTLALDVLEKTGRLEVIEIRALSL